MELLDKVNEIAKSAVSKTGEVLEDTRLKTQILNDEKSIRELQSKIGAFYYKKFAAGEIVEDEVMEFCTAISVHLANIEEKKAAMNANKRAASDVPPAVADTSQEEEDIIDPEEDEDPII